ncbi:FAD-dependent monooxygenase [Nonomuraea gerenzanensis]|uniref:Monooxygenase, FAD-binding n=1 Tax=Nonomuraea gerenzanensis TaxID=93944 RepID=A0A1M4ECR4_9ACTN|nr:FAD-dependent monooxygenase [Nonomuraea gerenzanensis]UBU18704.1 FAD-dependent monooxygenase [Nonomuraea gerenzanensis]SBO96564.1 monooxygenase, FAD-binding [Nonomuraea gerenzanensis]
MDVLVCGAGVAGAALAYWLRHHGFTPTVVERAPRARRGGYATGLRGEALDVLDRMALLEQVEALDLRLADTAGPHEHAALPVAIRPADLEILRDDLAGLLYQVTRGEVEYVFGDSIATLEQSADDVRVTFDRGRPRRFDLVAGADGLHSRTRSLVFGPHERFVRHLGLYTAFFGLRGRPGAEDGGRVLCGPGRAAAVLSVRDGARARAALHFASGPLVYDRDDAGQHKRIVAERFAGEGRPVQRLLEEMWGADDLFFEANAQVEMGRWSSGRVVLLGDAGHGAAPASGRGASQALIGAYILAGELATGGGHARAFAAYERELRGFVAEHQHLGREGADRFFLGTPPQAGLGRATARPCLVRLRDYAPGFAAERPSSGRTAR